MAKRRGAVVIGVNQTGGGLPALDSPAVGAKAFANWLANEGFEVKTITDANGPVKPEQVADAIAAFVRPGNCHQLIVYFSGHGYWKNDAELWLLTDAPGDANAAISWVETAEFAKDCGIPSVVMISDACRSIPNTPRALKVRGSIVFPNEDVQRSRAKVDKFAAAALGRAAFEVAIGADGRKESVFTHCFRRAFEAPDRDMIKDITEDGKVVHVVPNRRLEKFLQREVAAVLATVNVQLSQTPDAEVLSDDDVYIGRVSSLETVAVARSPENGPSPGEPPVVNLRDVAATALDRALAQQPEIPTAGSVAIDALSRSSGFNAAVDRAKTMAPISHFETETGFAIIGAGVTDVVAMGNVGVEILSPGDTNSPAVVRVNLPHGACSIMLRFANGRGTALAALYGYICHVLVDGNGVTNVSYVPANNSFRWGSYERERERVENLRAAAAAAVKMGVFRLDDKRRATDLARQIRMEKAIDPVLGLFASYAYSEADQREDVDSVRRYMRDDLNADLFDVAMLSRRTLRPPFGHDVVPFCPMLAQGWNFLRVRGVELPEVLDSAQDELERALWTTFKPGRMNLIIDAMKRGEIT